MNKTWIKAGTYDAGRRRKWYWVVNYQIYTFICVLSNYFRWIEEDAKDKGKIYRPTPKIEAEKSSTQRAEEYVKQLSERRPEKPKKKKDGEKKKTNLELFKEELKMYVVFAFTNISVYILLTISFWIYRIQEEREERHKYKGMVKSVMEEPDVSKGTFSWNILRSFNNVYNESFSVEAVSIDDGKLGSFDNGDPNTTNLYLGNLNPKVNTITSILIILIQIL